MSSLGADLERIVPDALSAGDELDRSTLALHLERYEWAARFARGRSVLDLACGVGYGSALLSRAGARATLGVDRDPEAITHAASHYTEPGLSFEVHDALTFSPPAGFDLVVSLETIEHVPDPARLIRHLADLVAPGGTFVGSVPVTVSTDANPYHRHDFTEHELLALIRRVGLRERARHIQVQRFSPWAVLSRERASPRALALRRGLARYYATHPDLLLRRARETLRYGFCNRYLIVAADKD